MIRISTAQFFSNTLEALQQKQTNLAELQTALATGKRINRPSDDPVGAGRIVQLGALTDRLGQFDRNLDAADARLSLEESTLNAASDALNRVREITIAAVNGINDDSTLAILGGEVRTVLANVLGLANTKDANGEYIFAGTRSHVEPFGRSPSGAYSYNGNADSRNVAISDNQRLAMTDPGSGIFFDIATGNGKFEVRDDTSNGGTGILGSSTLIDPALWVPDTYTIGFIDARNYEVHDSSGALVASGSYQDPTQISFMGIEFKLTGTPAAGDQFTVTPATTEDIFTSLEQLADALEGSLSLTEAARHNLIYRSLGQIDQALSINSEVRANIGSRLQQVDTYRELNANQLVSAQSLRSRIEDLDYAEAISQFQFETTTLEAAQKSFLLLKNLSLFKLL